MKLSNCIIICFLIITSCHQNNTALNDIANENMESYHLDTSGIANNLRKGGYYIMQAKLDSAMDVYNKSYTQSNILKYRRGLGKSLEGIAKVYFRKGDITESTKYLELGINKMLEDTTGVRGILGHMYIQVANNYQAQGQYSTSIIYCYKALDYLQHQPGELKSLAEAYSTMGGLWIRLGDMNQAIMYLITADSLAKSINYYSLLALNSINLGSYYSENTTVDSSLFYYKATLEYMQREHKNDILLMGAALTNISRIYYQKKMFREADTVVQQIISLTKGNNSALIKAIVDVTLGYSYANLHRFDQAIYHYKRALNYALSDQQTDFMLAAYQGLTAVYEETGDYKEAYLNLKHLDTLRQINEKSERNKTVDLLFKYHSAKTNEQFSQQQLKLSIKEGQLKSAYIWLMIATFIAIILLFIGVNFYRTHKHKQKLQQSIIQNIHDKQAFSNLQALMEGEEQERNRIGRALHDGIMIQLSTIKMQLNTINQASSQDQSGLLEKVNNLIKEVRFTAHNLMPDWLLEDGLGDAIRYFSNSIEQNHNIKMAYHQHGTIPRFTSSFEISIYRIVQELVQNIMKHAQSPKALIELSYIDGYLHIVVEDNGIGFNTDLIKEHKGKKMGLVSIKRRVKALNGKIELQSESKVGTTIYMEFDMQKTTIA